MALSKQAGEQRDKGKADKGNAAARHQLFHALRLCIREISSGVVLDQGRTIEMKNTAGQCTLVRDAGKTYEG